MLDLPPNFAFFHPSVAVVVSVGNILGKSPGEVAQEFGIKSAVSADIAAAAVSTEGKILVADPKIWSDTGQVCKPGEFAMVAGNQPSAQAIRLVFINGRLNSVRGLKPYLADLEKDEDRLSPSVNIYIGCVTPNKAPTSQLVAEGLVYGPFIPALAALKLGPIAVRNARARALLPLFRLGDTTPDYAHLKADHPQSIFLMEGDENDGLICLPYGEGHHCGEPKSVWNADQDISIHVKASRVIGIEQGYILRAACQINGRVFFDCQ